MRRKRVFTPKPPRSPVSDERAAIAASRTVSINLDAMAGRTEVRQGGRVRILSGLYAGELATVVSLVSGVIPENVTQGYSSFRSMERKPGYISPFRAHNVAR